MILTAALSGAVFGAVITFVMYQNGMLRERSGLSILLATVAIFYAVFAAAGEDWANFAIHAAAFLGFAWLAVRAWKRGTFLIVGGLIAHGTFDIGLFFIGHPGPAWWPVFSAAISFTIGLMLLRLVQNGRVPS